MGQFVSCQPVPDLMAEIDVYNGMNGKWAAGKPPASFSASSVFKNIRGNANVTKEPKC